MKKYFFKVSLYDNIIIINNLLIKFILIIFRVLLDIEMLPRLTSSSLSKNLVERSKFLKKFLR